MHFRRLTLVSALVVAVASPVLSLAAQSAAPKKALTVEDYTKWRSINSSSISSDGNWVTYVLAQLGHGTADAVQGR